MAARLVKGKLTSVEMGPTRIMLTMRDMNFSYPSFPISTAVCDDSRYYSSTANSEARTHSDVLIRPQLLCLGYDASDRILHTNPKLEGSGA